MVKTFLLSFIPLFVTVDAIGTLPIFSSLTQDLDQKQKKAVIFQSILTALLLAIGFVLLGRAIFNFLGIMMGDFMIAGGAVLFCIAIVQLINPGKQQRLPGEELGAVPIGTPLIVGPAVLTTSLMLVDQFGLWMTISSLLVNILLAGFIFSQSHHFIKIFGKGGLNAISRVMALLLVAIAVMMIRKGIVSIISL